MDPTKKPLGVVTMVYRDYFILERWYAYYADVVGPENLYIFSHGPDPRHDRIAKGANVIHIPRDETRFRFERRRWNMMSEFVTGMLMYYNWMILSDVDEFVVADPAVSDNVVDHLQTYYWDPETAPVNIAPLCLDMVHYPQDETEAIAPGDTILSRRRTFRPNRNYSKPNLVRKPVKFKPGGHANTLGERHLPDHLYMLHLKYFDRFQMEGRVDVRAPKAAALTDAMTNAPAYDKRMLQWGDEHQRILDKSEFMGEDIELRDLRDAMRVQTQTDRGISNYGVYPDVRRKLYRMPERFASVL
ncbi:glycosyltransferase family 2 protein [Tateyamaria sp. SN6-1]|uniref:glycosyltransferase family 2 protein n=1 Tax=Tateyamaria sp. SN6-1 TaxID=3092148 RepID=UPI0039F588F3